MFQITVKDDCVEQIILNRSVNRPATIWKSGFFLVFWFLVFGFFLKTHLMEKIHCFQNFFLNGCDSQKVKNKHMRD